MLDHGIALEDVLFQSTHHKDVPLRLNVHQHHEHTQFRVLPARGVDHVRIIIGPQDQKLRSAHVMVIPLGHFQ